MAFVGCDQSYLKCLLSGDVIVNKLKNDEDIT